MIFTYDRYKNIEVPNVYLAYPNKNIIGELRVYEHTSKLYLNNISSGTFTIYKYENKYPTLYYDKIKIGMLVEIRYVGWFKISNVSENKDENGSEYLSVEYSSIEIMLSNTFLTNLGSLGVESDEQGGLDRYCLYNYEDLKHSITHIFMTKNPAWYFKYLDPEIPMTQYRSFQIDRISSYEFLTKNVSEVYECIFIFDTYDMSISAYKLSNIGKKTSIFLSDRNFIRSITSKTSDDTIKTVFSVSGGNDSRTNSILGISEVNPSGNSTISNFDYFKEQMSVELRKKLEEYLLVYKNNEKQYINVLSSLEELYEQLGKLENAVPKNTDSTEWTEYGLAELEVKESVYWNNMSLYLNSDIDKYNINYRLHTEVKKAIEDKKQKIEGVKNVITTQIELAKSYIVNIQDFLGDELYKELSFFYYEQDFQDDSFVVTTTMSDNDILNMQKELKRHAENELQKVCYPQYEMTVDAINFTARKEFIEYTEQLELGNIITIEWDIGVYVEVRLLEMELNWDSPDNFVLRFSNKDLDTEWAIFSEIKNEATATAVSVDYNKGAWNVAKQTSLDYMNWRNNTLDASLQKLQNSSNQEVIYDHTGLILRKYLPDQNKYSPNQIWLTNGQIAFSRDEWESVCTAIGMITLPDKREVYGINGEYLIGEAIVGENFILRGSAANLDFLSNDDFKNLNTSFKVQNGLFQSYIGTINEDGILEENGEIYTRFEQTDKKINLKVSIDNIINTINLDQSGVLIKGEKIQVEGSTTFTSYVDGLTKGTTTIDGACIQTGTISAARIDTNNLTAENVNCGQDYFTAEYGKITLGNLKVYNNGKSTYLAYKEDPDYFGLGNGLGSHFWSNWRGDDVYDGSGSAEFQISTDGTMYVTNAVISNISARLGNIINVNGSISISEGDDVETSYGSFSSFSNAIDDCNDNIKLINEIITNNQTGITQSITSIKEDIKTINNDISEIERDISVLYRDMPSDYSDEIKSINSSLSEIEKRLSNLESSITK